MKAAVAAALLQRGQRVYCIFSTQVKCRLFLYEVAALVPKAKLLQSANTIFLDKGWIRGGDANIHSFAGLEFDSYFVDDKVKLSPDIEARLRTRVR